MNVYILTIDGDRDSFVQALDQTPMVRNWLAFLPTAIALVTYRPLVDISTYLRDQLPHRQHILVPATSLTSAGLLPPNVWDFINKPADSGKYAPEYGAYMTPAATAVSANNILGALHRPSTPTPSASSTLLAGLHHPSSPPATSSSLLAGLHRTNPPAPTTSSTLLTGLPTKFAPAPSEPKSSLRRLSDFIDPDKK